MADQFDEKAAELLPCAYETRCEDFHGNPFCIACTSRDAVATALRSVDTAAEARASRGELRKQQKWFIQNLSSGPTAFTASAEEMQVMILRMKY